MNHNILIQFKIGMDLFLQDDTAILEEKKYMNVFHANL